MYHLNIIVILVIAIIECKKYFIKKLENDRMKLIRCL